MDPAVSFALLLLGWVLGQGGASIQAWRDDRRRREDRDAQRQAATGQAQRQYREKLAQPVLEALDTAASRDAQTLLHSLGPKLAETFPDLLPPDMSGERFAEAWRKHTGTDQLHIDEFIVKFMPAVNRIPDSRTRDAVLVAVAAAFGGGPASKDAWRAIRIAHQALEDWVVGK